MQGDWCTNNYNTEYAKEPITAAGLKPKAVETKNSLTVKTQNPTYIKDTKY